MPPNPEADAPHPADAHKDKPLSPPAKRLLGLLIAKYGNGEPVPETYADAYNLLHRTAWGSSEPRVGVARTHHDPHPIGAACLKSVRSRSRTSRTSPASRSPRKRSRTTTELGQIMQAVEQVSRVATPDVPPTSHPIPMQNVFRDDVVGETC